MRGGLGFLILILAMAALKAALALIVASIGLALVVSIVTRPRETILLTVAVGAFGLAHAHPIIFALTTGLGALLIALMRWEESRAKRSTSILTFSNRRRSRASVSSISNH